MESDRFSALVKLPDEPYRSDAGTIWNLKHGVKGTVSVIESKAGSTRAVHRHLHDDHYLYVVQGCVQYYERPAGSNQDVGPEIFRAGDMFFTPSGVEHKLTFTEPTIMVSMSSLPRDHESHEKDVVRVKW